MGSTMIGLLFCCIFHVITLSSASVFDQRSVVQEYIVQLGSNQATEDELVNVPGITITRIYTIGLLQFALIKTNSIFSQASLNKNIKLVPNRIVEGFKIQGLDNQGIDNKDFDDQGNTFGNNSWNECYQQDTGQQYWGLSRISNIDLPNFDTARYLSNSTGQCVTVYVMDTGVNVDHETFGQRAHVGYTVEDLLEREGDKDLAGHGTHVAGLAAGNVFLWAERGLWG